MSRTVLVGHLILGVVIDPAGYERVVPAFRHTYPNTMRTCPESGRALWSRENALDQAYRHGLDLACADGETSRVYYLGVVQARTPEGSRTVEVGLSAREIEASVAETARRLEAFGIVGETPRFYICVGEAR